MKSYKLKYPMCMKDCFKLSVYYMYMHIHFVCIGRHVLIYPSLKWPLAMKQHHEKSLQLNILITRNLWSNTKFSETHLWVLVYMYDIVLFFLLINKDYLLIGGCLKKQELKSAIYSFSTKVIQSIGSLI
jgi:hypothetical protein